MKLINYIADAVALGGAIVGSALIAANIGYNLAGYVAFFASSLASFYLLKTTPNAPKSLLLQNLFFIVINCIGLFRA